MKTKKGILYWKITEYVHILGNIQCIIHISWLKKTFLEIIFTQYYSDFYDINDGKKKKLMVEGLNLCPPNIEFCLYTEMFKWTLTIWYKNLKIHKKHWSKYNIFTYNSNFKCQLARYFSFLSWRLKCLCFSTVNPNSHIFISMSCPTMIFYQMLSVLMGKFIEKHVTKQALTEMKKKLIILKYSHISYTIFHIQHFDNTI